MRDPPPTNDGEYVARIVAQDMNPTLVYADPDNVATLLAATPEPEETAPVVPPVQQDLQDNAGLVFFVLGALHPGVLGADHAGSERRRTGHRRALS